ncbi:MAG: UDP-N-acetylmuramate dehydrogenase [Baekduia sp.]|nr:UDP-N-acetylmuramate dehydrogenase [Baekduia sp.]
MDLSGFTTLRLGGPPAELIEATTDDELRAVVCERTSSGTPLLVLAGGSNVVVADEGFGGTVVHVATRGTERDGDVLHVAAGEPWDAFVARCVADGLAGIECLAGIPGSVGATPIQNVGAYGQDVSETIVSVRALDRATGVVGDLAPAGCGFAYRSSAFKRDPGRWTVLRVSFALTPGDESRPVRYAELARALGIEVGATPIQNVGAYGQDVSETVVSVRALDRATGAVADLTPDACGFAYRSSAFKREPGRWVVLRVSFALAPGGVSRPIRYAELARTLGVAIGDTAPLADVRDAVLALRRGKGMVLDPADRDTASAGSFFTNPILTAAELAALQDRVAAHLGPDAPLPPAFPEPDGQTKTSAAWLIERAGFQRGYGDPDGIAISTKHVLALTNRGAGTTAGLVALAREIADGVEAAFGVRLVPEPVFVGHAWDTLTQPRA